MTQYSEMTMLRANLMGGMNAYILDGGDEDVIEMWLTVFPDGCDEDTLMEMAQDEEIWLSVVQCFARCGRSMGWIE